MQDGCTCEGVMRALRGGRRSNGRCLAKYAKGTRHAPRTKPPCMLGHMLAPALMSPVCMSACALMPDAPKHAVPTHAHACTRSHACDDVAHAGGAGLDGPLSSVSALAILAIIVTVHELGHFTAARSQGIHVTKFAIGFGPPLVSFEVRRRGGRAGAWGHGQGIHVTTSALGVGPPLVSFEVRHREGRAGAWAHVH
eukprot:365154-Chlamydomonas_euryale.AAC.4